MKIEMQVADPVKDAAELSRLDKKIYLFDWWDIEDWEPYYKVRRIKLGRKKIGSLAFALNMAFSRGATDKAWAKAGSIYLATLGILPEHRTLRNSNAAMRWMIQWAKDHGWDAISTNCRKSDSWYLKLCLRFGFRVVDDVPYFVKPTENTIVLKLQLK